MSLANALRLITLSAIWGGSFLFMRLAAPVLAPTVLVVLRVGLAALFLAGVVLITRQPFALRQHARHFLVLGLLNAAVPFTLFAFAAKTAPAGLLAVLNGLGQAQLRRARGEGVELPRERAVGAEGFTAGGSKHRRSGAGGQESAGSRRPRAAGLRSPAPQ